MATDINRHTTAQLMQGQQSYS